MKWAEVDLSWRRKRLPFAPTSSTLPAYERRKRLFQLFKKLDTANTGTINISDISLLLKAMGHSFDKTELDRAIRPLTFSLLADDGGTECKAIDFADFCQWWAALDWFDSIGMAQHALSSASVRHLKREWLDEAEELKEDAKRQTRAQVEATEDQARAARWAARRFDSPAKPDSEPELQLEHPPPPPHHRQSESLPGSDGSNLNIQAGHGSDSKSQDSSSSTSHGASSLAADLRLPVGAAAPGRAAASHGDSESAAGFQLQPEPEAEQPTCQRDRDRDHDHDGRRASHGDRDRVSESPANTLSHSLNLKLAPSRPRHAGGPAAPAARKASDHGATGSAGGDGDGAQNLDVQVQVGRGSGSARDRSQPDSEAASERSQGPLGPPAPLAPAARADSEASRHGVGSEPSSSCGQPRAGPASETGTGEAQTRTRSSGWRPGPRPLPQRPASANASTSAGRRAGALGFGSELQQQWQLDSEERARRPGSAGTGPRRAPEAVTRVGAVIRSANDLFALFPETESRLTARNRQEFRARVGLQAWSPIRPSP